MPALSIETCEWRVSPAVRRDPRADGTRDAPLVRRGFTMSKSKKLVPSLWYAKEAEEAARFYASIFPDSRVDRVWTMAAESPSGPPGSVKVVDFTLFGQPMQAMSAGPHHEFNDAISFTIRCDTQAELDNYWNAILEGGGKAVQCGWITDRFGVRWQIVPEILDELMADKDQAKAKRVAEEMLKEVKLDIAKLKAAAGS
jgi:predicted 3-demethylubiquinone-9 3-methyltransferase (glyoxalase superfamily)